MNGKYYEISKRYPRFLTKAVTLSYDDGRDFDRKMIEILNVSSKGPWNWGNGVGINQ